MYDYSHLKSKTFGLYNEWIQQEKCNHGDYTKKVDKSADFKSTATDKVIEIYMSIYKNEILEESSNLLLASCGIIPYLLNKYSLVFNELDKASDPLNMAYSPHKKAVDSRHKASESLDMTSDSQKKALRSRHMTFGSSNKASSLRDQAVNSLNMVPNDSGLILCDSKDAQSIVCQLALIANKVLADNDVTTNQMLFIFYLINQYLDVIDKQCSTYQCAYRLLYSNSNTLICLSCPSPCLCPLCLLHNQPLNSSFLSLYSKQLVEILLLLFKAINVFLIYVFDPYICIESNISPKNSKMLHDVVNVLIGSHSTFILKPLCLVTCWISLNQVTLLNTSIHMIMNVKTLSTSPQSFPNNMWLFQDKVIIPLFKKWIASNAKQNLSLNILMQLLKLVIYGYNVSLYSMVSRNCFHSILFYTEMCNDFILRFQQNPVDKNLTFFFFKNICYSTFNYFQLRSQLSSYTASLKSQTCINWVSDMIYFIHSFRKIYSTVTIDILNIDQICLPQSINYLPPSIPFVLYVRVPYLSHFIMMVDQTSKISKAFDKLTLNLTQKININKPICLQPDTIDKRVNFINYLISNSGSVDLFQSLLNDLAYLKFLIMNVDTVMHRTLDINTNIQYLKKQFQIDLNSNIKSLCSSFYHYISLVRKCIPPDCLDVTIKSYEINNDISEFTLLDNINFFFNLMSKSFCKVVCDENYKWIPSLKHWAMNQPVNISISHTLENSLTTDTLKNQLDYIAKFQNIITQLFDILPSYILFCIRGYTDSTLIEFNPIRHPIISNYFCHASFKTISISEKELHIEFCLFLLKIYTNVFCYSHIIILWLTGYEYILPFHNYILFWSEMSCLIDSYMISNDDLEMSKIILFVWHSYHDISNVFSYVANRFQVKHMKSVNAIIMVDLLNIFSLKFVLKYLNVKSSSRVNEVKNKNIKEFISLPEYIQHCFEWINEQSTLSETKSIFEKSKNLTPNPIFDISQCHCNYPLLKDILTTYDNDPDLHKYELFIKTLNIIDRRGRRSLKFILHILNGGLPTNCMVYPGSNIDAKLYNQHNILDLILIAIHISYNLLKIYCPLNEYQLNMFQKAILFKSLVFDFKEDSNESDSNSILNKYEAYTHSSPLNTPHSPKKLRYASTSSNMQFGQITDSKNELKSIASSSISFSFIIRLLLRFLLYYYSVDTCDNIIPISYPNHQYYSLTQLAHRPTKSFYDPIYTEKIVIQSCFHYIVYNHFINEIFTLAKTGINVFIYKLIHIMNILSPIENNIIQSFKYVYKILHLKIKPLCNLDIVLIQLYFTRLLFIKYWWYKTPVLNLPCLGKNDHHYRLTHCYIKKIKNYFQLLQKKKKKIAIQLNIFLVNCLVQCSEMSYFSLYFEIIPENLTFSTLEKYGNIYEEFTQYFELFNPYPFFKLKANINHSVPNENIIPNRIVVFIRNILYALNYYFDLHNDIIWYLLKIEEFLINLLLKPLLPLRPNKIKLKGLVKYLSPTYWINKWKGEINKKVSQYTKTSIAYVTLWDKIWNIWETLDNMLITVETVSELQIPGTVWMNILHLYPDKMFSVKISQWFQACLSSVTFSLIRIILLSPVWVYVYTSIKSQIAMNFPDEQKINILLYICSIMYRFSRILFINIDNPLLSDSNYSDLKIELQRNSEEYHNLAEFFYFQLLDSVEITSIHPVYTNDDYVNTPRNRHPVHLSQDNARYQNTTEYPSVYSKENGKSIQRLLGDIIILRLELFFLLNKNKQFLILHDQLHNQFNTVDRKSFKCDIQLRTSNIIRLALLSSKYVKKYHDMKHLSLYCGIEAFNESLYLYHINENIIHLSKFPNQSLNDCIELNNFSSFQDISTVKIDKYKFNDSQGLNALLNSFLIPSLFTHSNSTLNKSVSSVEFKNFNYLAPNWTVNMYYINNWNSEVTIEKTLYNVINIFCSYYLDRTHMSMFDSLQSKSLLKFLSIFEQCSHNLCGIWQDIGIVSGSIESLLLMLNRSTLRIYNFVSVLSAMSLLIRYYLKKNSSYMNYMNWTQSPSVANPLTNFNYCDKKKDFNNQKKKKGQRTIRSEYLDNNSHLKKKDNLMYCRVLTRKLNFDLGLCFSSFIFKVSRQYQYNWSFTAVIILLQVANLNTLIMYLVWLQCVRQGIFIRTKSCQYQQKRHLTIPTLTSHAQLCNVFKKLGHKILNRIKENVHLYLKHDMFIEYKTIEKIHTIWGFQGPEKTKARGNVSEYHNSGYIIKLKLQKVVKELYIMKNFDQHQFILILNVFHTVTIINEFLVLGNVEEGDVFVYTALMNDYKYFQFLVPFLNMNQLVNAKIDNTFQELFSCDVFHIIWHLFGGYYKKIKCKQMLYQIFGRQEQLDKNGIIDKSKKHRKGIELDNLMKLESSQETNGSRGFIISKASLRNEICQLVFHNLSQSLLKQEINKYKMKRELCQIPPTCNRFCKVIVLEHYENLKKLNEWKNIPQIKMLQTIENDNEFVSIMNTNENMDDSGVGKTHVPKQDMIAVSKTYLILAAIDDIHSFVNVTAKNYDYLKNILLQRNRLYKTRTTLQSGKKLNIDALTIESHFNGQDLDIDNELELAMKIKVYLTNYDTNFNNYKKLHLAIRKCEEPIICLDGIQAVQFKGDGSATLLIEKVDKHQLKSDNGKISIGFNLKNELFNDGCVKDASRLKNVVELISINSYRTVTNNNRGDNDSKTLKLKNRKKIKEDVFNKLQQIVIAKKIITLILTKKNKEILQFLPSNAVVEYQYYLRNKTVVDYQYSLGNKAVVDNQYLVTPNIKKNFFYCESCKESYLQIKAVKKNDSECNRYRCLDDIKDNNNKNDKTLSKFIASVWSYKSYQENWGSSRIGTENIISNQDGCKRFFNTFALAGISPFSKKYFSIWFIESFLYVNENFHNDYIQRILLLLTVYNPTIITMNENVRTPINSTVYKLNSILLPIEMSAITPIPFFFFKPSIFEIIQQIHKNIILRDSKIWTTIMYNNRYITLYKIQIYFFFTFRLKTLYSKYTLTITLHSHIQKYLKYYISHNVCNTIKINLTIIILTSIIRYKYISESFSDNIIIYFFIGYSIFRIKVATSTNMKLNIQWEFLVLKYLRKRINLNLNMFFTIIKNNNIFCNLFLIFFRNSDTIFGKFYNDYLWYWYAKVKKQILVNNCTNLLYDGYYHKVIPVDTTNKMTLICKNLKISFSSLFFNKLYKFIYFCNIVILILISGNIVDWENSTFYQTIKSKIFIRDMMPQGIYKNLSCAKFSHNKKKQSISKIYSVSIGTLRKNYYSFFDYIESTLYIIKDNIKSFKDIPSNQISSQPRILILYVNCSKSIVIYLIHINCHFINNHQYGRIVISTILSNNSKVSLLFRKQLIQCYSMRASSSYLIKLEFAIFSLSIMIHYQYVCEISRNIHILYKLYYLTQSLRYLFERFYIRFFFLVSPKKCQFDEKHQKWYDFFPNRLCISRCAANTHSLAFTTVSDTDKKVTIDEFLLEIWWNINQLKRNRISSPIVKIRSNLDALNFDVPKWNSETLNDELLILSYIIEDKVLKKIVSILNCFKLLLKKNELKSSCYWGPETIDNHVSHFNLIKIMSDFILYLYPIILQLKKQLTNSNGRKLNRYEVKILNKELRLMVTNLKVTYLISLFEVSSGSTHHPLEYLFNLIHSFQQNLFNIKDKYHFILNHLDYFNQSKLIYFIYLIPLSTFSFFISISHHIGFNIFSRKITILGLHILQKLMNNIDSDKEIRNSIYILINNVMNNMATLASRNYRFHYLKLLRSVQKLEITVSAPSKERNPNFADTHHCILSKVNKAVNIKNYHKKSAFKNDIHGKYHISKYNDSENIIWNKLNSQWSNMLIFIREKESKIKLCIGRWFPIDLIKLLDPWREYLGMKNRDQLISSWVFLQSHYVGISKLQELQKELDSIHKANIKSICFDLNSPHTESNCDFSLRSKHNIKLDDLEKKNSYSNYSEWWSARFSVECMMSRWRNLLDDTFNQDSILLWLIGWPKLLPMLDLAKICLQEYFRWLFGINEEKIKAYNLKSIVTILSLTFLIIQISTYLAVLFKHNIQISQRMNVISLYRKFLYLLLRKRRKYSSIPIENDWIWNQLFEGPIFYIKQYILKYSIIPTNLERNNSYHNKTCQQFEKSTVITETILDGQSVYSIENFYNETFMTNPSILFLNSYDTFLFQIPWDTLYYVGLPCFSLGIDPYNLKLSEEKWCRKYKTYPSVPEETKIFAIINPSGDLPECRHSIPNQYEKSKESNFLSNQVVDCVPVIDISLNRLSQDDIYIYCGHQGGKCNKLCTVKNTIWMISGSQYIPRELIQSGLIRQSNVDSRISRSSISVISMLMGCSSVKFENQRYGFLEEVDSLALDFLIGGSPAVIGMIRDVTNLDLDRLTYATLLEWAKSTKPEYSTDNENTIKEYKWGSLIYSRYKARKACHLQLITGGGCIHIGLPI